MEEVGYMALWLTNNEVTVDQLIDDEPESPPEDRHYVQRYPKLDAFMLVKTVEFTGHTIEQFGQFLQAIEEESGEGYCERSVEGMTKVSNQDICNGVDKNIGYYYATTFPVAVEGTEYCFKLPTDFGNGGVVMMDGEIMKQAYESVWKNDKSTTNDFCATLHDGNHMLEVYGASECCDKTTAWQVKIGDGKWMDYTVENFNGNKNLPPIEGDMIVEFGDYTMSQENEIQWHQVEITGVFNDPVVVMGPLSFNGPHAVTVRVKDVTRTSF